MDGFRAASITAARESNRIKIAKPLKAQVRDAVRTADNHISISAQRAIC
jgi:hypothetical protein